MISVQKKQDFGPANFRVDSKHHGQLRKPIRFFVGQLDKFYNELMAADFIAGLEIINLTFIKALL